MPPGRRAGFRCLGLIGPLGARRSRPRGGFLSRPPRPGSRPPCSSAQACAGFRVRAPSRQGGPCRCGSRPTGRSGRHASPCPAVHRRHCVESGPAHGGPDLRLAGSGSPSRRPAGDPSPRRCRVSVPSASALRRPDRRGQQEMPSPARWAFPMPAVRLSPHRLLRSLLPAPSAARALVPVTDRSSRCTRTAPPAAPARPLPRPARRDARRSARLRNPRRWRQPGRRRDGWRVPSTRAPAPRSFPAPYLRRWRHTACPCACPPARPGSWRRSAPR